MERFLIGFTIGAAIGVAVVVVTAPRSGPALRHNVKYIAQTALDVGKQASAAKEDEMWAEFRKRLKG